MSSPELATMSPEVDAQEDASHTTTQPPAPDSTSSAAAPSTPNPHPPLGEHCTSDRPTPSGQAPAGELTKLNNIDVYISKPPTYPSHPARLLLLLTGGTGLLSTNNQLQADLFARAGYVVLMPDLFAGDPAPNSTSAAAAEMRSGEQERESSSFLDLFKTKAAEAAKSFLIDMWLARHTEVTVMPLLEAVLEGGRDEFADAVAHGGGVYAVGYCFGARYVLLLAAEKEVGKEGGDEEANRPERVAPQIKAGALAHATMVDPKDFEGLKAPLSVVCVEEDPLFPDEVRIAGEEYMSAHGVEHEVSVYPGVPHGFAVVGDYEDANIKVAQATAFDQMLKWIEEH